MQHSVPQNRRGYQFLLVTLIAGLGATVVTAARPSWIVANDNEARSGRSDAPATVASEVNPHIRVPVEPLESAVPRPAEWKEQERKSQTMSARATITRGRFTSYQVNVNAGNANIVGDAANEPSMTLDLNNPNRIAIGWRQFDTITNNFRQAGRAYSIDGGLTWTFPGVLTPGVFRSDPVLASDGAGNFYYSSLTQNANGFQCDVFKSLDGGQTWGAAPAFAFGGDKQWMVIDTTGGIGDGNIYQVWNGQTSPAGWANTDFTRSIDAGASFQAAINLPNPQLKWGTLDVGPDGELYIVGSTLNQSGHLIAKSSSARNTGVTPTFEFVNSINLGGLTNGFTNLPPNPGGILGQTQVVVNHSNTQYRGEVYVLQSVLPPAGDPLDVMLIRSTNGGLTFSSPTRVNDDTAGNNAFNWFGTISVAPNGRVDVVWNDTRNDVNPGSPTFSESYYRYSYDGGRTWYAAEPFTPQWAHGLGYPQQNKIGDYSHLISENSGAKLAYAATFNGEQDVYFVRLTPDCNANGIADETDIANATSEDCNGNIVPDECEPSTDCNSNAIPDICDVANGTSQDCNLNQIPDECEGAADCNNNTIADFCDIASGTSEDCNSDGIPDECQTPLDCNNNGSPDVCDVANGTSQDCNANAVPDECDISSGTSQDANGNTVPDECEGACCLCDVCTVATSVDCANQNGAFYQGQLCTGFVCPNPNTCANNITLPSETSVNVPFSNVCATNDGPATVSCDSGSQQFGTDLWYTYVAPCCGSVTFSLCTETNFDAMLAVYGGATACTCPTNNANLIFCSDDSCGGAGGPATITVNATTNHCYTVRVGGWQNATGHGELNITATCNPIACGAATEPDHEPVVLAKNRYLSIVPTNAGQQTAIRVTLESLPAPFGSSNGQVRWVGTPGPIEETSNPQTFFKAAKLVCNPVYRDWGAEGLIQVSGDAIVPGGKYRVQAVQSTCAATNDCNFSAPIFDSTQKWGDVASPFASDGAIGQPNFIDVSSIVAKFQGNAGAIIKARADIQPDEPDRIVNFLDISADVTAFQGEAYPFNGPSSCP